MSDLPNDEFFPGQNYKQLFSQAKTPIALYWGPDLTYVFVNEEYSRIFNGREMIGKTVRQAFPELEGQPYFSILENVFTTGEPFFGDETPALIDLYHTGTPTIRYYNLVYTPYRNGEGQIRGVMAMGYDVTEQVEARRKIAVAEENARLAIESADLGTYEVDMKTNEITSSARFNAIFGFDHTVDRFELVETIHPEDRPLRDKAYKDSMLNGHLRYEARIIWHNKSEHWIKVNGRVLFDADKKPARLLGVVQDISEQKFNEEQLSRKVEERTRALREANERLQRSNDDLERFAYTTSHDLQEPLRKIQIFNSMLLNNPELSEESRKYIEKVGDSAKRMAGLINELLNYSKVSEPHSAFERVDLNTILRNVLSDYELLIAQKNAVITNEPLMVIEAVPLQMNQLFYNLIGNSLKFATDERSPVISISCSLLPAEEKSLFPQLLPEKVYCRLRFADNGIGFSQDDAEKMFTIFERLHRRQLYAGYGIGLALCRKIAEAHQGIISAEGKEGAGAVFTILLPVSQHGTE